MPSLTDQDRTHLLRSIAVAADARAHGNHPFGAIVVTAEGTVVEAENTVVTAGDPTGHAETNLVRIAAATLSAAELQSSTLFSSTEPCAMCAGAIFWAGIPRVVFAFEKDALVALLPAGPTDLLAIATKDVLATGGRPTEVIGPVDLPEAAAVHAGFWS